MGDERKQYENICKAEFNHIKAQLDKVLGKLYIDNGGESFQSKINRHDIWIRRFTRVLIAVGVAVFGLCIHTVQDIIKAIIQGM